MNIDPIIVAMASCVQMLDTSHPDEVDPDFAVKVQEVMGEYLLELPASDEPELRATLLRIAADHPGIKRIRGAAAPLILRHPLA